MPQDYYLKLIDTLDKPFENHVFEKLVVLYDNIGEFATLLLDRTKLNPERRKMTDSMLREIQENGNLSGCWHVYGLQNGKRASL